ncbi:MAG TPA: MBL fold metallo-hydrolase [Xanthobacteraceae bacterium]|nr:MBL fold metallo-hydrolase [Xanthobacteraceae bacterium]
MTGQIELPQAARADDPRRDAMRNDGVMEVSPDLACKRLAIVNVAFYGPPRAGDRGWVLIDAGLVGTRHLIVGAAARRFGRGARPSAIVLTHGHFDHVGELGPLAQQWDVPIYAHRAEHPYLNGTSPYPPADPAVGGGLMAWGAALYPRGPINVRPRLRELPRDGTVPEMPGWSWIHTPGHAPGHVSLWRAADRALVAGDAFVTTRQESAYAVLTQGLEMHGPPQYFTPDWAAAARSVRLLADLRPEVAITGHGRPVRGPKMREALDRLARDFMAIAVPRRGRYVGRPQTEGSS